MAAPASPVATKPTLTDSAYNAVRQLTTIWLPALATLYLALDGIFGLPAEDKVVATVAAINVFLGVVLAQSRKNFNDSANPAGKYDGDLAVVQTPEGKQMVNFAFNVEPEQVLQKDQVVMKVTEVKTGPQHRA